MTDMAKHTPPFASALCDVSGYTAEEIQRVFAQTKERLTAESIASYWSICGALWAIENPNLFTQYMQEFILVLGYPYTARHIDLYQIATQQTVFLRHAVARNLTMPSHILELLQQEPESSIRTTLASHPQLSAVLFATLAKDTCVAVRAALAANPELPAKYISIFAEDVAIEVRKAIVQRRDIPLRILQDLAEDALPAIHNHARRLLRQRIAQTMR